MNFPVLAAKNVLRNRFRTAFTVIGVAVAIITFMLLRTVLTSWDAAINYAAKDRLATRNKVSWVVPVPKKIAGEVEKVEGVQAVSWMNFFGGKDPNHKNSFFMSAAVNAKTIPDVYPDMELSAEEYQAWMADKQGVVIGDALAKNIGYKVGDTVTLVGTIYPKRDDWPFTIRGIYKAKRKSLDRTMFLFHWDYLNDNIPEAYRDQLGWLVVRVADGHKGDEVAKAIDTKFEDAEIQTFTQSELAMSRSFMGMFSAILTAMNIVSAVILVIMMLILGNTIAMGVRERTNEYGVLRAIGFLPRHIGGFIIGEALTIGLLGGGLGLGLGVPLVKFGIARWLEENLAGVFPVFRVEPSTIVMALLLALALGAIAAALPAWRASKLSVVDALRRVG